MDISDAVALASDLELVRSRLAIREDEALVAAYLGGSRRNLLAYNSVETEEYLHRCLVVCRAFLLFPSRDNYYNIEHASRAVPAIRLLGLVLRSTNMIIGVEARLARLRHAADADDFDQVFYEVLVATRYAKHPAVRRVELIAELPGQKNPDILVSCCGEIVVECKKSARRGEFSSSVRDEVTPLAMAAIETAAEARTSFIFEASFAARPSTILLNDFRDAARAAMTTLIEVKAAGFSIVARPLAPPDLKLMVLHPSPKYFLDQYDYTPGVDWHGIAHTFHGEMVGPWLNWLDWEAAVKWRLTDQDLLWKCTKLPFDLVFKGLKQLSARSERSILHFAFERVDGYGHRQQSLYLLADKLKENTSKWGWIMFDDLDVSVSRGGRFSLEEHVYMHPGPTARFTPPLVSTAYTGEEDRKSGVSRPWGIGTLLPSIDEEHSD